MSDESNEQVLRAFYGALNQGDLGRVLDLCHQEVEVYTPPDALLGVPPRGREEVTRYLQSWFETWDLYHPEPEEFVSSGDQVVAFVNLHARGKGSRFDIEEQSADIFTLKDEKVVQLRFYVAREQALEAVGLRG
jgi:ketosteroid isomerase-like protein